MRTVDVLIEHAFLGDQTLTYQCDSGVLSPFMRVQVPLQSRKVIGFVLRVNEDDQEQRPYALKAVLAIIDDQPILNDFSFALARWLAYQNAVPLIMALQAILPSKIKPRSSAKAALMTTWIHLEQLPADTTEKQRELIDALREHDLELSDVRKLYGGYRRLEAAGFISRTLKERTYQPQAVVKRAAMYTLNEEQTAALAAIDIASSATYLLFGATGSGKTEIYLHVAQDVLETHRQVLILVPEIGLTPQMIQRFRDRFGADVGIYHSQLSDQEKYEQYVRVKQHEVSILIGTRSAVFLPFADLGLIVMDEEHDLSYKNSNAPFYHARDVAAYRSQNEHFPVLLGSASPSFESYSRALRHNYQLLVLKQRVFRHFPKVQVIDTTAQLKQGKSRYLSQPLLQAIEATLAKNQQVILLLNRRGYNTIVRCKACNEVLLCPHCDIALNYHKSDQSFHCHYCGYTTTKPRCPQGHYGYYVGSGVGTQRLQEEIQALFPHAVTDRFDADSTRGKEGHKHILDHFIAGETNILIGTQMIAKGIDIPNVTLVGIINGDALLQREEYRSVEMVFDLLLQAAGRSGRGHDLGKVLIQTSNPQHYAIIYASHHDYPGFFMKEMKYRKLTQYPPYSYLISLVISDRSQEKVQKASLVLRQRVDESLCRVLGPVELNKLQDRYRSRMILKGKDLEAMIQHIQILTSEFRIQFSGLRLSVDVNPLVID